MPEMLKYCGRTMPVGQRADTTCNGGGVVRRMANAVHLQKLRCDGSAHGGCEAGCLLFWKEAWLERVQDAPMNDSSPSLDAVDEAYVAQALIPGTRVADDADTPRYRCQATEIPKATDPLPFLEVGQYTRGLRNWRLAKFLYGLPIALVNIWQAFSMRRLPHRLRIADGQRYPFARLA